MKEVRDKLAEAVGTSQRRGWSSSGGGQRRMGKGLGWRGAGKRCQVEAVRGRWGV